MAARKRNECVIADLFEPPMPAAPMPVSMDFRRQVSALVAQVLKDCPEDRYTVSARMGALTGREVSKLMLDGYTAESREAFNVPLYLVPALETATGSHLLSQWLASSRGGRLLLGRDVINAEIGRLQRQQKTTSEQLRRLLRCTEARDA